MAKTFLTPIAPPSLTSDPQTGVLGAIYFNSTQGILKYYNGSVWAPVASSGIAVLPDDPSNPSIGQIYFNSSQSTFKGYNGSNWYDVAGPKEILEHSHGVDGFVDSVEYANYVSEDKVFANSGSSNAVFIDNFIDGGGA